MIHAEVFKDEVPGAWNWHLVILSEGNMSVNGAISPAFL